MKEIAGVWIDHNEAVVVKLNGDDERVIKVTSEVEARHRSTGGVRSSSPFSHRTTASGRKMEAHRREDLRRFFDEVDQTLGAFDALFIIGPGECKKEFYARIAVKGRDLHRIEGMAAAESNLTIPQIVHTVRAHFQQERPRVHLNVPGQAASATAGRFFDGGRQLRTPNEPRSTMRPWSNTRMRSTF